VTDSPWLNLDDAARYALVGRDLMRDAVASGECVGYQSMKGGRWRVHRDDLDRWIRGDVGPATAPPLVTRRKS
jgi:excisionase family DNA binding protein